MHKQIIFIINPVSGTGKQKLVEKLISNEIRKKTISAEIQYTKAPGHAESISREAAETNDSGKSKYQSVVAIGGDGTVNEVSRGLIGSKLPLGIIPIGSGNGLARFLRIPMNSYKALGIIKNNKTTIIDTATINSIPFVNVAGIGFDAHISHRFAAYGKRGIASYLKLISTEFIQYSGINNKVKINGEIINGAHFLISFANSSEFGNNAHICPKAKITDGLLDICFLRKFPVIAAPFLAMRLFNKTFDRSRYCTIHRTKALQIYNSGKIKAHIDGDPIELNNNLEIKVLPKSLYTIVP